MKLDKDKISDWHQSCFDDHEWYRGFISSYDSESNQIAIDVIISIIDNTLCCANYEYAELYDLIFINDNRYCFDSLEDAKNKADLFIDKLLKLKAFI